MRFAHLASAAALLLAAASLPLTAVAGDGFWSTPTIHGHGKIHVVAGAVHKPDPARTYKVVFELTHPSSSPSAVNGALDHVARTVNIFVAAGVPLDHLKIVAVAAGPATPIVLDNAHYRAKFGVDNPNLPLIRQLTKDGVEISVCAQAMGEHHFKYGWQAHDVTLSLSALSTVITLQNQGYALEPM